MAVKIFHPLMALIPSASNNELAKYVEFLKEENKILRSRIPGQVHTKPDERSRLIKLGKALGQGIEELITVVAPSTFCRWCREEFCPARFKIDSHEVGIPHVRLPPGPPSEYRLRAQQCDQNLCTLEAIARAIGILECRTAQTSLETLLRVLAERTL